MASVSDSALNGNSQKSSLDAVLDRMVASGASSGPDFIPASAWEGPKRGYYFGTSDGKLGYHRDHANKSEGSAAAVGEDGVLESRKRSQDTLGSKDGSKPRKKLSAEELLEQAEQAVDPQSKVLDLTTRGIKYATTALDKVTARNALQRAQFSDQPEQYMDSELALFDQVSSLSAVAVNPQLFPAVLEYGMIAQLAQLLSHDNSDVALSVIHVLVEWLDLETYTESEEMQAMAQRVVTECLEHVVANVGRLDPENVPEDKTGLEDIFSLVETLLDMDVLVPLLPPASDKKKKDGGAVASSVAARLATSSTSLVGWLLQEIETHQSSRAVEVLSLILQQSNLYAVLPDLTHVPSYSSPLILDDSTTPQKKPPPLNGMEILLQALALYRKHQPETDAATDFVENVCLSLASALTYSPETNVKHFIEAQGVELVLRCIKEKVHAGGVALKLLDFRSSRRANEYLVTQASGLKFLFPLWVGRSLPKPAGKTISKRRKKEWFTMVQEQLVHIFYNLSRHLSAASPDDAQERFLVKLLEEDKCDRLVELCLTYDDKAQKAEYKFYRSSAEEQLQQETSEEEVQLAALHAKLRGGGDLFHRLGAIAVFVCGGSKKGHKHILQQLTLQQSGIGVIKAAVEEFASMLDDGEQKEQLLRYLSSIV